MNTAVASSNLRMVNTPCNAQLPSGKKCRSMFRNGDTCNKCGSLQPAPPNIGPLPDGNDHVFSTSGHAPKGLGWNKSQHKVIR
jgi:hypothetical protein